MVQSSHASGRKRYGTDSLHGSATTTAAVRRAIQHGKESLRALATRYGIYQKTVQYDDHKQIERHLSNFLSVYNFGHRLKTLNGLIPCEFTCKTWVSQPERFTVTPLHRMPGLNT